MANFKRIFFTIVILLGLAFAFRYWALYQFNIALSTLDTKQSANPIKELVKEEPKSKKQNNLAEINILFPTKKDVLYMGCTYSIAFATTTDETSIQNIKTSLVDAGTGKPLGPLTSGLNSSYEQENISSIEWTVGNFWPGEYRITMAHTEKPETVYKSERFNVEKFEKNLAKQEKESLCLKSGGIL